MQPVTSQQQQHHQQQQHLQQSSQQTQNGGGGGGNSLLKQQLRVAATTTTATATTIPTCTSSSSGSNKKEISDDDDDDEDGNANAICEVNDSTEEDDEGESALQSLANAAERQAAQAQHQLMLLNMAAGNYSTPPPPQEQQEPQHQQQHQQQLRKSEVVAKEEEEEEASVDEDMVDMLSVSEQQIDEKIEEPETDELLTLADENAGFQGYNLPPVVEGETNDNDVNPSTEATPPSTAAASPPPPPPLTTTTTSTRSKGNGKPSKRPIQRRRVRRKAQSTIDDQAEHLTEMSVRGLDLFRYASVSEGVYKCTECAKENMQKTFKNKYSFQRHAFLYHEGKHRKVFPCPVCSKEFSRPDKMKNHLKMTHEGFTPPKDLATFGPLKYLLTAATAEHFHTSPPPQPPPQPPPPQQQQPPIFLSHHHHQLHQHNQHQLQPHEFKPDDEDCGVGGDEQQTATSLSLPDEIVIKNEIQISPSPSPSPPPVGATLSQLSSTAQTAT